MSEPRKSTYDLNDLTELEARLLYNGLKLQAGDFECLARSYIWGDQADSLKDKFPPEIKW